MRILKTILTIIVLVVGILATVEAKTRNPVWPANGSASSGTYSTSKATTSAKTATMNSVDEIIEGIRVRSESLTFISETDSPVSTVRIDEFKSALTPDMFLQAIHSRLGNPIEERDYDHFFDTQTKYDARWADLKQYISDNVPDLHVYAIGTTQLNIYVVGVFNGSIVGIRVYAVET
jgi:hypothetical protein